VAVLVVTGAGLVVKSGESGEAGDIQRWVLFRHAPSVTYVNYVILLTRTEPPTGRIDAL
jgi:hypothetical protein